jgi:hypothetical protein
MVNWSLSTFHDHKAMPAASIASLRWRGGHCAAPVAPFGLCNVFNDPRHFRFYSSYFDQFANKTAELYLQLFVQIF